MAESPVKPLSPKDWSYIANWIKDEKERRARSANRRMLEKYWAEIDRQVAMEPLPRIVMPGSGKREDWLPNTELPLQFNTLEVNAADAHRLKFPRGSEWYQVSANITDKYEQRFQSRRERFPMVGGVAAPMKMTQEAANTLVKATVDHFHRLYDFRAQIDLFDVECIKYGTGILRVKEVVTPKFFNDFRGTQTSQTRGPAVVPVSIKTVLLDDTPAMVMLEGITVSPGQIRCLSKKLADLKNAIKTGGPERGWRLAALEKLEPDPRTNELEFLEFEGDLVVPRDRGKPIFLPGCIVTIAAGKNPPEVVRYLENEYPFSSYTVGHYMRDSLESPYGTSPLIKGQPLQEASTAVLNDLLAAASLSARPPAFYDRNDPGLTGQGGPNVFPGANNAVDSPEAVNFMERSDISPLFQAYLGLVKQYEDLTAVNDPRRGGAVKSHTTAAAVDIEQSRGLSRTDDFVQAQMQGPITTILYKQFEIAKRVLSTAQDIQVDQGGIEGWLRVAAGDLPDEVAFRVHGSAGLLNERQGFENYMAAVNTAIQIKATAMQMGIDVPANFDRIIQGIFTRAGVNEGGSLFGIAATPEAVPGGAAAGPALPPGAPGIPTNTLSNIQAAIGV